MGERYTYNWVVVKPGAYSGMRGHLDDVVIKDGVRFWMLRLEAESREDRPIPFLREEIAFQPWNEGRVKS